MAASEQLGIKGVHSFHYFVEEAERSRQFYQQGFGWTETARASRQMVEQTGQESTVFQGGDIRLVVSTPKSPTCRAARYLSRHPAGIGSLSFEVENLDRAWKFLLDREATPIHAIRETQDDQGGLFRHFSITTAFGDVAFRFIETKDHEGFAPGFSVPDAPTLAAAQNPTFKFKKIDHITCNAQTMAAPKLWLEHVLGMEQCWGIEFHTDDITENATTGTGLRSVVMWDPRSGIKFPINEPLQPFFKDGQINKFVEDNCGAGVQHIALEVDNILESIGILREREVGFLHTPGNYYDTAPARLKEAGVDVDAIAHKLADLRKLGILIDGSPVNNYLIQIFLKDAATRYNEPSAGPFFFEIIQRCGDQGFGGGNFRALFEAIEREQTSESRQ